MTGMRFLAATFAIGMIAAVLTLPTRGYASGPLQSVAPIGNPARCTNLKTLDFSALNEAPSQIVESHRNSPANGVRALCVVEAYAAPQVGFRLFLPEESWNEKFIQIGSGGHAGFMHDESCASALAKGYACVITDMGHKGTGLDSQWARGNPQALINWGYRATHVVTVSAKAIITAYYGRGPSKAYFSGCSTGGRQALQEAQKFPWDYDGIIAGAPPIRLSDLYVMFTWSALANRDAAGRMILKRADLELLNEASLAECDLDDGIRDGLIARPQQCRFKPSKLACRPGQLSKCLTDAQVKAADKIYSGPVDAAGRSISGGGALPGSERLWARYYLDNDNGELPYMFPLTRNGLGDLFSDPQRPENWSIDQFNFAEDYKELDVMQSLYDSSNPDLTRFAETGGKMIIYIGLGDVSMPGTVIDYYEKVDRLAGGAGEASKFARLFLLPGVDHCSGGPGADQVDYLGYLENWVEKASPPDVMVATHVENISTSGREAHRATFSRPVYPYPAYAKYKGKGDPAKVENFEPAMSKSEKASH